MACKGVVVATYDPEEKLITAELKCVGKCGNDDCPEPKQVREDSSDGGYTLHYKCQCKGQDDGGAGDCGTELIFRFDKAGKRKVEVYCPHSCQKGQVEPKCKPVKVKEIEELVGIDLGGGRKDESLFGLDHPKHNIIRYYKCACPIVDIKQWF